MEHSVFSIIIATYNRAAFIGRTLDSILQQSNSNWEVIIVDDGGNDNTREILAPYLKDSRISFFKRPKEYKKGCPGSRNFGLSKARGEFIWFFDDDDIAHPNLLKTCHRLFQERKVDFVRFGRSIFYEEGDIQFENNDSTTIEVSKKNLKQMIIGDLPFNSCQVIWARKSLGEKKFKPEIIYADDWEFYSRLLSAGLKGISTTITLLFARKHPGSATFKYKSQDRNILKSVTLATFSVIDTAKKENILDEQLFQFFYRRALLFRSYSIVNHLLQNVQIGPFRKIKYRLGFYFYPVIRRFFYLRSKLQ